MPRYLIYRHGSNAANQRLTQTAPVAIVSALCAAAAKDAARNSDDIDVYANQTLEAVHEDDADIDDWNAALEDGCPCLDDLESPDAQEACVKAAESRLDGQWEGERYVYFADETRSYWHVTRDDMVRLGRALIVGTEDAYSLWCASSDAEEVEP